MSARIQAGRTAKRPRYTARRTSWNGARIQGASGRRSPKAAASPGGACWPGTGRLGTTPHRSGGLGGSGEREARRRVEPFERVDEPVTALRQRGERGGGGVGEGREHAGLLGREAAAVEAARVAEDDRPLGPGERHGPIGDLLGELVFGWIVLAERAPGPEPLELSTRRRAGHVLERPGALVDVDEVDERLDQAPVVEVPVPALRYLALPVFCRRRVPEVEVLELGPHAEVGVGDVEQTPARAQPEPGVVEPELDPVALPADDELLAGSAPEIRLAVGALLREP